MSWHDFVLQINLDTKPFTQRANQWTQSRMLSVIPYGECKLSYLTSMLTWSPSKKDLTCSPKWLAWLLLLLTGETTSTYRNFTRTKEEITLTVLLGNRGERAVRRGLQVWLSSTVLLHVASLWAQLIKQYEASRRIARQTQRPGLGKWSTQCQ